MARPGFLDVGLDEEAVFGDVGFAGFNSAEDLCPRAVRGAEVQHADLVGVTYLREDDGKVAEALQSGVLYGNGHLAF